MVDTQRFNQCKKMKKRIVTQSKSSDNRESVRANQRRNGRCNNQGLPMYGLDVEVIGKDKFDTLRTNKSIIKAVKKAVKNNISYTKEQMKLASKIFKNPSKYSELDVKKANQLLEKLGKYKGLVCIDDLVSKIRKVS